MNLTRPIEWEIRGVLLIRGKPCDSQLGHGFGRTEPEAIAHWKQKKLSGWAKDACAVYALPAPIFRVNRIVAALTLLGSLALTSEPAWGVSEGNTLEIHTLPADALVRYGVYANETSAAPEAASECVTAGETAPILAIHSPADSDSGSLVRSVAKARWTSGNGSDASDHLATSLPTASEATPTPRFNCRSENRLRTLRESEEPSEDGTHSSCNSALMGKLADGGQLSSPHIPTLTPPSPVELHSADGQSPTVGP